MINKNFPVKPFVYTAAILLPLLSLSRLLLSLWQHERVAAAGGWTIILLQGLRVDIATLSIAFILPMLVSILLSSNSKVFKIWTVILKMWLVLVAYLILFIEMTTPSFIIEYNIRPNRIFIEYLIYPKEVLGLLTKAYWLESGITLIVTAILAFYLWRKLSQMMKEVTVIPWKLKPLWIIAVLFMVGLGARSTLGHRPLNPAMVYFSDDPLVNSLILNSFYSTSFAAKQMFAEESKKSPYGKLPEEEIIQIVREFKGIGKELMLDPTIPTLSAQKASYRGKPKNLVIILEESLGARFVGSLGGLPLTPNYDKLSKQGWSFESMLATGTRSVRGIEAVITGFTPTPDRAVVKLGKSQNNFFTIAELLKRKGYHTEFIYGGEAHFDNMKSFFLGNGFQRITEEKDYIHPHFVGSWGASDEDLFTKADIRFTELASNEKPFMSLVFTSSNHSPFEYPNGRITAYDKEYNTRNNAIVYADWALGEFFKRAKKSNYWKNTLFVIVADHDANAHGKSLVPPKSFHIPALILGDGIQPKVEKNVRSQLDLPPTMLSLIGIDNVNPMIGRDLTKTDSNAVGRAMMQYGQNFAYLLGDKVTVLQPEKEVRQFIFDKSNFSLIDVSLMKSTIQPDTSLYKTTLGLSLWGKLAYYNQYYHLPKTTKE